MRNVKLNILFLFVTSFVWAAKYNPLEYTGDLNSSSIYYNTHSAPDFPAFTTKRTNSAPDTRGKESKNVQSNTRTYIDGISDLTTETFTPLNVGVSTPIGQAIGSVSLQKRVVTETMWEFSTNDLDPGQNIFDQHGRALLVDGKLSCRITHRESLGEYSMAGLTLGMNYFPVVPGVVNLSVNGGGTFEKIRTSFWESSQSCPVGPIPAFTTTAEIAKLCAPCHKAVEKTLKQDVVSRMSSLKYMVNSPLCQQDSDCESAGSDGRMITANTIGRCILVKDQNGSHYSECRTRAQEGRSCPGTGSYGAFEYACDRGLECVKIHEGKGLWNWSGKYDYSKYVCMKKKSS